MKSRYTVSRTYSAGGILLDHAIGQIMAEWVNLNAARDALGDASLPPRDETISALYSELAYLGHEIPDEV